MFHYDSFTSAVGGLACEAAYLCSSGMEVTVLVSPSNLTRMISIYQNLPGLAAGGPRVEPLLLQQRYLNGERLMTLMAISSTEGQIPLYIQVVLQILREMAREPNLKPGIDYRDSKRRILAEDLTPAQLGPLSLRLDLVESFIAAPMANSKRNVSGNDWTSSRGKLIIVDLSCPFVDADTACALFDIYLGVFLEQKMDTGRVVALDEAHKVGDTLDPSRISNSNMCTISVFEGVARGTEADRIAGYGRSPSEAPGLSCNHCHSGAHHISEAPRPLFIHCSPSIHLSGLAERS